MKTPEFVRNLAKDAELGLLQPALSRDQETNDILRILSAPEKPNCALLGPPGSGKSAIVEGLAHKIHCEQSIPFQIYQVDLAAMNAGTIYRGMTEERAKELLAFGSSNRNIVLFIDELHMLAGLGRAGDSGASSDVSQILKPALARGTIRCIGATTEEEFNQYLQPDAAIVRRFQIVRIRSLEGHLLETVIRSRISDLEARLLISLPPDTTIRIIQTAAQIFPNRAEPDRSLDVLRRIAQHYQDRKNLRVVQNHSLEQTLDILRTQRAQIESRNISGAAETARDWLGLGSLENQTISLTEIDSHLSVLQQKMGS